jgi:hypothetical protein
LETTGPIPLLKEERKKRFEYKMESDKLVHPLPETVEATIEMIKQYLLSQKFNNIDRYIIYINSTKGIQRKTHVENCINTRNM